LLEFVAVSLAATFTVAGALDAQQISEFRSNVSNTFGRASWGQASWGMMVVSLDAGDTLFAVEPDSALAPASNLKLLTSAAALRALGAEYRFRTYVITNGEVDEGIVDGDLILYGTGDPGISDRFYPRKDEVFHRLIDQLAALGIHTVKGDLVGDASYLPGPLRPAGWEADDLNEHFAGAVSALSYNENVVSFQVVPSRAGQRPLVTTVPPHSGLQVLNTAETVTGSARPRLAILRDKPLDPVRVQGRVGVGTRDVWRQMTVSVPAHFTASSFRESLKERGIEIRGGIRIVETPEESALGKFSAPALGRRSARVLARHISEPLPVYLEVVNKESNNLFAELLYRTIGRVKRGSGSSKASARAIRSEMEDIGIDMSSVVQLDGSGLSAGNRVSAATFVEVIDRMANSPEWTAFWASLPEAGRRRGLRRMYRTAAVGNLRAKTGTIAGVSALSGMVRSANGERLAFSIIVNGTPSQNRAKGVENQIGALLASFERVDETNAPEHVTEPLVSTRDETADTGNRHHVAPGENLSMIAYRYGITLSDLLQANPNVDANRIRTGQWLEIPTRRGSD
jgi:D-alanyl-D-alanine carboxypeptidase/D-alanyl-D-alanine-endopeptidase (penicillin-binding protein 4)|tara:strand:+ start:139 stop:1848 length:1710 start_codon:yes stop_codon:yes gene_type:complete